MNESLGRPVQDRTARKLRISRRYLVLVALYGALYISLLSLMLLSSLQWWLHDALTAQRVMVVAIVFPCMAILGWALGGQEILNYLVAPYRVRGIRRWPDGLLLSQNGVDRLLAWDQVHEVILTYDVFVPRPTIIVFNNGERIAIPTCVEGYSEIVSDATASGAPIRQCGGSGFRCRTRKTPPSVMVQQTSHPKDEGPTNHPDERQEDRETR
jgi:hypothetical protein